MCRTGSPCGWHGEGEQTEFARHRESCALGMASARRCEQRSLYFNHCCFRPRRAKNIAKSVRRSDRSAEPAPPRSGRGSVSQRAVGADACGLVEAFIDGGGGVAETPATHLAVAHGSRTWFDGELAASHLNRGGGVCDCSAFGVELESVRGWRYIGMLAMVTPGMEQSMTVWSHATQVR